ncbi:MAG TPA: aminotransferase class I/II-fold pyridoxal phosphate-dependent enzyme [Clostridiaceae bacterium]|nr:aminotransferase class I/II-fold pyridoxal phosphate-dependent enzyme [Clostridiaceae bacterium]
MSNKLSFSSDYMEGAHPEILRRLLETNMEKTNGYGLDPYSESAKEKIRAACNCPDAEVNFLVGGTQTNATVIDALLRSYQGVLAPESGHINTHEAGAIEFGGHKVLTLRQKNGKITAEQIREALDAYNNDANHDHMVLPGMVYISQPTEYGTIYSLDELRNISKVCRENRIPLYVDGARLAYALACPENDVTLRDLAELCDVFYIGGTKCGALFGEAVVIPRPGTIPHFFTIIKQHGALLAKGRLLGLQFDTLFTDGLYEKIGQIAIDSAARIRSALRDNGYQIYTETPTNQIFVLIDDDLMQRLSEKVNFGFWEKYDENHTVIRFATSWATAEEDVNQLIMLLSEYGA